MKKYIFSILTIFCLLYISCNSVPKETPKPQWVDGNKSVYPDSKYISVVGEGFSKKEALSNAEEELAKYFGQNVKSTVTSSENWSGNDIEGYKNDKTLSKEYVISFDVDLFAVEKTKPWYNVDTGSYFVCAYMNRQKSFELYRQELLTARKDFYNFYNKDTEEYDLYQKLEWLEATKIIADKYNNVLDFAQCLNPSVYKVYKDDFEAIANVNSQLKAIQVEVSKRPEWIDNKNKVYPSEEYIAQVGSGSSINEAISNAENELAKYFGQTIQSKVTSKESWSGNDEDGYKSDKSLDKEYMVSFNVELFAVEKTMPWYNTKNETFYVCAFMNRKEALEKYEPTIKTARTDFYNFYNKSIEEQNLIKKIDWLEETKIIGAQYREVLEFANGLQPTIYEIYKEDFEKIVEVDNLLKEAKIEAYKRPDWVDTPKLVYPDAKYIARVGEGDSKEAALINAEKELSKYFGQNVKSTSTATDNWSVNGKDGYKNEKSLNTTTEVSVDVELFAVEKTNPWYDIDADTYFICAYIDREKAYDLYKPNITSAQNAFQSLYNKGINEPDLFKQIKWLEDAKESGKGYTEILDTVMFIYPDAYDIYKEDIDNIASIDSKINEAKASAYSVKLIVNNDYGNRIYDNIAKIISNNGFTISNSRYQYTLYVDYNDNRRSSTSGIFVAEPSITISLKNKINDELFTYAKECGQTKKSFNENTIQDYAFDTIKNELNLSFANELKAFFEKQNN